MTSESTRQEKAGAMTADYLGDRLDQAGDPPGLQATVEADLVEHLDSISQRGKSQRDQLRARRHNIPPAYYAHEEAPEDALQTTAAGLRIAMATAGHIVEPMEFEQRASAMLAPTAAWALRSEAARVPRPPTRPANLEWTLPPVPWADNADHPWPPPQAAAIEGRRHLQQAPTRCNEPPYQGWVQLGLMERQRTFPRRYPKQPAQQLLILAGLETSNGTPSDEGSIPFAESRPTIWNTPHGDLLPSRTAERAQQLLGTTAMPLATMLALHGEPGAPHIDRGAGLPPFLLGPRIELAALLGLRPEDPALRLMLVDDNGPALVCRQWNGFLIHDGNYEPLEPAIHGTDLLLRPDLYRSLEAAIGKDRVTQGLLVQCRPN